MASYRPASLSSAPSWVVRTNSWAPSRFASAVAPMPGAAQEVFQQALAKSRAGRAGCVKAIRVPGGADKLTRKMTDGYTEFAKQFKVGGVAVAAGGVTGAITHSGRVA